MSELIEKMTRQFVYNAWNLLFECLHEIFLILKIEREFSDNDILRLMNDALIEWDCNVIKLNGVE